MTTSPSSDPQAAAPDAPYCANPWTYQRRATRVVRVGKVHIGGDNPIRVQSMLTCDTMDTEECVKQTTGLVEAGCEIVRITAPTKKDAANLENIRAELNKLGCDVPLVADIHFKPDAAMEAAKWVDKVRINPGNFVDKKKFVEKVYDDAEYADEVKRIEDKFIPLVEECKRQDIAMRIGTNHGSLSDRIMNYYGDTPLGMVESALEFARIARACDYHNFLFSMKASNPKVMINAYRMLVARLNAEGPDWNYPIHLGVTEAGDGEDGRIKSAIGIGSLLADGLGDTIRVSLTEDAIHEIPVARALVAAVDTLANREKLVEEPELSFDPLHFEKRETVELNLTEEKIGGIDVTTRVACTDQVFQAIAHKREALGDLFPDFVVEQENVVEVDPRDEAALKFLDEAPEPLVVTVKDGVELSPITAFRLLSARIPARHPILLKDTLTPPVVGEKPDVLQIMLVAATNLGSLLADGVGDGVLVRGEPGPGASVRLAFNILQSVGNRIFKTDYVACPSCGRTLFDLQSTTARIRSATDHLKGVKIAIMGCIVNGPGEMADADFGYVGGAPGKINLYVGKTPVKFNIPSDEAVDRLKDLIAEHGKWVDPPEKKPEAV